MPHPPRLRACLLPAALLAAACGPGRDLAATSSSASSAGSGGSGGASSGTGSGASSSASSSAGTGGSGGGGIVEPPGATKLTIVNGVTDYPAVRLCFLPGDAPWPASTSGLAFAGSQVVASIAAAIPIDGDVTPWVIAGDLSQTAGKSCTEILALASSATPPIIARALAVIPKVVWDSHRSLLMVPNGCLGGPTHDDINAKQACGSGYTPATPTAGVMLAGMSRLPDTGHVSLQVASASTAMPEVDVALLPNLMDAMPQVIVRALTQGGVGPKPPFAVLTVTELGALEGAQIQTYTPQSTFLSSTTTLAEVFANGGPGAAAVANGKSVALVAVGAAPGLPAAQWWHKITFALVEVDP